MGVESAYLGVFGSDDAAAHVHDTAQTLGLDMSHCRYEDGENGYSQVDIKEGDRIFTGSNKGGVLREHPVNLAGWTWNTCQALMWSIPACSAMFNRNCPSCVNGVVSFPWIFGPVFKRTSEDILSLY